MSSSTSYSSLSPTSRARASLSLAALLVLALPACSDSEEASCGSPRAPEEECASTPVSPQLESALDELLTLGAPGVIAFSRQGSKLSLAARGVADVETGEPIDVNDRFRAASTGKSLIATVILQLVGERALSLDDTLERWLPGILPRGSEITLRQLLNHTSGVAHSAHDPNMVAPYLEGNLEHYWSPRELVAFSAARPLAFEPGQGYLYSNTNYQLLGLIIEAVTARDPLSEVSRRLLEPLRMTDSSWPARDTQIDGPHAHGYHFSPEFGGHFDMTVFSPSWTWTAGGLISTVTDLARFNRSLFSGELLAPAQMSELLSTVETDEGGYGLGVAAYDTPCGEGWGHEGDFPGYHTFVMTSLGGERQAVVLINSDDAIGIGLATEPLARAVFAAFCPATELAVH